MVEDYPTRTVEEKLRVPLIEKQNGNLTFMKQDVGGAIKHYNKALFGIKMLFDAQKQPDSDQHIIKDEETA